MPAETPLYIEIILLLLAIGGIGGFLSGLLGAGGGIIFVPALFFSLTALDMNPEHIMHVAIGTSLAVVLATSATSAFHHHKRGSVDLLVVRRWGPYIVGGVALGSLFASTVDGDALRKIFAGLLIVIAVYMAFSNERQNEKHSVPPMVQHIFCIVVGALSAMAGIGGAILNIPMMVYSGVPMQRAVGTGVVLAMVIALPGMAGYMISGFAHMSQLPPLSLGYVNLIAVATIIPTSILVAPFGVKIAHRLPKAFLKRIFAAVMVIVSLRMFMTL